VTAVDAALTGALAILLLLALQAAVNAWRLGRLDARHASLGDLTTAAVRTALLFDDCARLVTSTAFTTGC
jgi:hypothetical protein